MDYLPLEHASKREVELRRLISQVLIEKKIRRSILSRETGISEERLRSIFANGSRISILEMFAILHVAGYDFDIFQDTSPNRFDPSD